MASIIKCESSDNPNAVGDNGTSFGLSQIHLTAHTDITKQEALDPEFAINYLAYNLSIGKASMWTCARLLGYVE